MSDNESQALATELLHELKQASKRWFIAFLTILILWFATIGVFIWYISLPVEYEDIVRIENDDGNANYIGRDLINSEINNGENNSN